MRALSLGLGLGLSLALCTSPLYAQDDLDRREKERLMLEANTLELTLVQNPALERPPGTVLVRLAFPAEADLDLFVTDPSQESVYFANSPGKNGGLLEADLRCNSIGPRIEQVVFSNAAPGDYRVGVDFPARCDDARGEVSYVVHVESDSGRLSRRHVLARGIFDAVSLEFVVDSAGAHPR